VSRVSEALKALRGGEVKAAVPGSDIVLGSVSTSTISTAQIDRAMDGAARMSSVLAAALTFSARNFAEAPLVVMRNGEADYTHPLSRAFARPTPWHSQTAFWQRFAMLLLTDPGGAYIVAAHDDSGEVGALWARSSRHVRPRLSQTEYISGWKFVTNGFEQDVDPARFTVVRQQFPSPEPGDEFYSLCPIEQVRKEVRTHVTASLWLDNILQNMGVSSGLIGIDHPALDHATAKAVQDEINERMGGPHRGGTFSVLAGKVSVDKIGMSLDELDFGPLMDRVEVAVARAFGIPAELLQVLATVGKGEGLNASAYRDKARIVYDNSIIPLWKDVAEAVGTFIGPLYGLGPEDVAFDYSGIESLADDKLKRFQTAVAALPFAELNEAREIAGLEPKPWGNINIQASVYGRLAQPTPAKAAPAPERKAAGDPHLEWYARWDAKAAAAEPAIERAAREAFAEEAEAVAEAVAGAGSAEDIERAATGAIDPEVWVAKMTAPITATLAGGYAEVQQLLAPGKAAPEGVIGLTDPAAIQAALEQVSKVSGEVTQTTKDRIAEIVAQSIANGWSPDETAQAIADYAFGGDITEARAILIARTESVTAMSRGGLLGAKDVEKRLGLSVQKAWLTAGNDARPLHLQAEAAGFVPLDSDFGVGAQHPGGFGIAGQDANCRCALVYEAK
jgi:HK97 family phage portal protein